MTRTIEYFFTLSSPWSYLGHPTFVGIAARHGTAIRYRPMPVRRVFDETGGLPLPKRHPVRQSYRLVELQRWREKRGLRLNLQPRYSFSDIGLADRCVLALLPGGHDPDAFVRRAGAAQWTEEKDLADPDVLADLLRQAGVADAPAILSLARSDAIAAEHERNFADALATGVFGAPTYVLEGEPFWGQDRLELLDETLAAGRAPFRPER